MTALKTVKSASVLSAGKEKSPLAFVAAMTLRRQATTKIGELIARAEAGVTTPDRNNASQSRTGGVGLSLLEFNPRDSAWCVPIINHASHIITNGPIPEALH